jgi:catechol 2,3-dioxygenase-like lactoylglutathione lyase family enzyme
VCAVGLTVMTLVSRDAAAQPTGGEAPRLTGSIIFLYYEDLDRAAAFYGETLGLEETYQQTGVRVFSVTPSAALGLIDVARADDMSLASKTAFVAFIVEELDEVDRWHALLASQGVEVTDIVNGTETPARSFWFEDPGGYTVELFAWLDGR